MVGFLHNRMPSLRNLVMTNIRLEERSLLSPHRVLANLTTFSLSLRQPLTHLRHLSARTCPAQGSSGYPYGVCRGGSSLLDLQRLNIGADALTGFPPSLPRSEN